MSLRKTQDAYDMYQIALGGTGRSSSPQKPREHGPSG